MRKIVFCTMWVLMSVMAFAVPKVTDVVVKQRYPWGLVDITCKVSGINGDSSKYRFYIDAIFPDSGKIHRVKNFSVMRNGMKSDKFYIDDDADFHLLWDAKADLGEVSSANMVVRIKVDRDQVQLWEDGPYWATTNIGAEKPEDYGCYFYWGDVVGYKYQKGKWSASDGSDSNFSFGLSNTPTYNKDAMTLESEGWITSEGLLASEYDAAQVQWGGDWRMPTSQEIKDLKANCDWEWIATNGVYGCVVRGKGSYASNSIFLPAAGYGYESSFLNSTIRGYYWSSEHGPSKTTYVLNFSSGDNFTSKEFNRYYGQSIRPVLDIKGCSGDSTPFLFESEPLITKPIMYNSSWIGCDLTAEILITDNGKEIKRTTGEGVCTWAATPGKHTLTYITYINGVQQEEIYTATIFKDWKYTLEAGKATIIETTQTSGAVIIPSEIDGYSVVGLGAGLFNGCEGLTSVTIPDCVTDIGNGLMRNDWVVLDEESDDENIVYKTNDIDDDNSTFMEMTIVGPVEFSFDWKVSSESDYDCLKWYFDGTQEFEISGVDGGWQNITYSIPAGEHTIKWDYSKDGSFYDGEDCGWVRLPRSKAVLFDGCKNLSCVTLPVALEDKISYEGCSKDLIILHPGYECKILFDPNGGELSLSESERMVLIGERIGVLPVPMRSGYIFIGWFTATTGGSRVSEESSMAIDTILYAQWKSKAEMIGMLFGGEWQVESDGDADVIQGETIKFIAEDLSSVWIETEVTNACRVTFKWKSSCEPLVKGLPWDYFSFEVDGEQKGFICGEKDWAEFAIEITGDGIHRLRWCFQRDGDGSAGENSAWLADLKVIGMISVSFDAGGATDGNVPSSFTSSSEESFLLPNQGSLVLLNHTFIGWSDGVAIYEPGSPYLADRNVVFKAQWVRNELNAPIISAPEIFEADSCEVIIIADEGATIYYTLDGTNPTVESSIYTGPILITKTTEIKAMAIRDNYFDSSVVSQLVTRNIWTFGEYLNWPKQEFTNSGDGEWLRVKGVSSDGFALKSGKILRNQKSSLSTIIQGAGTISFMLKTSCESDPETGMPYDGFVLYVDGNDLTELIGGELDWQRISVEIVGNGPHIVEWCYKKDKIWEAGEDCVWIDEVLWIPANTLPELSVSATVAEVAVALEGSADVKLVENIKTAVEYAAFREWVLNLEGVTPEEVKASPNAWLSYALNTDKLIIAAPKEGDIVINTFESAAIDGAFEFTVKIDGIEVGDNALEVNLKKVFDVEGCNDLKKREFSTEVVGINVAAPLNGNVKFVVKPKMWNGEWGTGNAEKPNSFFFRVKMK